MTFSVGLGFDKEWEPLTLSVKESKRGEAEGGSVSGRRGACP